MPKINKTNVSVQIERQIKPLREDVRLAITRLNQTFQEIEKIRTQSEQKKDTNNNASILLQALIACSGGMSLVYDSFLKIFFCDGSKDNPEQRLTIIVNSYSFETAKIFVDLIIAICDVSEKYLGYWRENVDNIDFSESDEDLPRASNQPSLDQIIFDVNEDFEKNIKNVKAFFDRLQALAITEQERLEWFRVSIATFNLGRDKLTFDLWSRILTSPLSQYIVKNIVIKGETDLNKLANFEILELFLDYYLKQREINKKISAQLEKELLTEQPSSATISRGRSRKKTQNKKVDEDRQQTDQKNSSVHDVSKTNQSSIKTREASPFVPSSAQQAFSVNTKRAVANASNQNTVLKNKNKKKFRGTFISDFLNKKQVPHKIEFDKIHPQENTGAPTSSKHLPLITWKNASEQTEFESKLSDTKLENASTQTTELSQPKVKETGGAKKNRKDHAAQTSKTYLFTPCLINDAQHGFCWDTQVPTHVGVFKTNPDQVDWICWTLGLSRTIARLYPSCIPVCYVLDTSAGGSFRTCELNGSPSPIGHGIVCLLAFYVLTEGGKTFSLSADFFGTPLLWSRKEINLGEQSELINYLDTLHAWQSSIPIEELITENKKKLSQRTSDLDRIPE